MFQFLVDHNFNEDIIRAWRIRSRDIDVIFARDAGLQRTKDPDVLSWAAQHERIVLTHDRNTMARFANERVADGMKMPGMFIVDDRASISRVVDDLLLISAASNPKEWLDQVGFLPF